MCTSAYRSVSHCAQPYHRQYKLELKRVACHVTLLHATRSCYEWKNYAPGGIKPLCKEQAGTDKVKRKYSQRMTQSGAGAMVFIYTDESLYRTSNRSNCSTVQLL